MIAPLYGDAMSMHQKILATFVLSLMGSYLSGCAYLRIDPDHFLFRSDVIKTVEQERAIVSKAKLEWTEDGRARVLYLSGNAYER